MKKSQKKPASNPSPVSAFLVLLLLIGAMVGVGFLTRNALFSLLERYSRDFGTFVIYTGFVGISLIVAVVTFGIMRSAGVFKKTTKKVQYEFYGAMAGFLVTLMFLVGTYSFHTQQPTALQIVGNVRFVEDRKSIGPVQGAKIALSRLSGFETETDRNGNFTLQLPEDQKLQELELQVTYGGKTLYHTVQRSMMENVLIEILKRKEQGEKLEPFEEGTYGILVAAFEGKTPEYKDKGIVMQGTTESILNARFQLLEIENAEAREIPTSLTPLLKTHEEAREIGKQYNAELVIWGDITFAGVIPNLTIVNPQPDVSTFIKPDTSIMKATLTHAALASVEDIRLPALTDEPALLVSFVTGLKYYNEEQYEKALYYFTAAIPERPTKYVDSAIIFLFRGEVFFSRGKYDKAISDWDWSFGLGLNPSLAIAYNDRGLAYFSKGEYDEAISDYDKAIKEDPTLALAYNNRGLAYINKDEYDKAISNYDKAIEISPEYAAAYLNRANNHYNMEDYDKAISNYDKAIEIDPKDSIAYYNRGFTYSDKGEYDKAISDYDKAIELDSKNAVTYFFRGLAYHLKEEYEKAISDCDKAPEIDPKDARVYGNLGWIFYLMERLDESIETSRQGLSIDSTQKWIQFNLALALLCQGNVQAAKAEYQRGIEMADSVTLESAINDLKGALEKDPNLHGAKEILTELTQTQ
ncbi:MAG: hypothetical protein SCARUB_02812 [Candidatus Scalindua rubra]|uniref:Uncharacterized protein n=1 Tax=Candidatus Scalindua rubra TaxID=1872076 RepID=A0A1E3X900_9BACT|nr:MAG: hypothetical protein SCARUB_02812 [Candidatus Scalindua rubra]